MKGNYPRFHRHRTNLIIHLIMVPVLVASVAGIVISAIDGRWLVCAALVAPIILSLVLQRIGHGMEPVPPDPFAGPGDFARRILTEQFYKFPLFVLSGAWLASWRAGGSAKR